VSRRDVAFRNASIKTKLILVILSICASILFLSSAIGLARTLMEGRQRLLNGLAMSARLLAEYCVVPLSFDDAQEAANMLERVQSLPGIQSAVLYDSAGTVFAAWPHHVPPAGILAAGSEDRYAFGDGSLTYSHPVVFRDNALGTLVLRAATGPLRRAALRDAGIAAVLFAGLILISFALAWKMQGTISRPILRLTEAFRRVSDRGDLTQRVHWESRDEIGVLFAGYNHMLDRLQTMLAERDKAEAESRIRQQQLLQAGKLVTLGTLVSGVAHEINNPNAYIMLNASMALKQLKDMAGGGEELRRFGGVMENMYQGSKRIDSIVKRLKDYYRKDQGGSKEPLDVNTVAAKAIEILDVKIRAATRRFRFEPGPSLPKVAGNFQELEQVLINLIENACQSLTEADGQVTVRTSLDGSGKVVLEVEDTGIGIPSEHLDRITDPFFTTKRESGGTGLGLSLVLSILSDHGGMIRFAPGAGKGTLATVFLPALP
jgi:signal transduction histidine kinase